MFKSLPRENKGLVEIENYKEHCLPTEFEITEVLDDIIMAEYIDTTEDGRGLKRNGIILPQGVVDNKSWRVGRVLLAGPNVSERLQKGTCFIFPGDKGMPSIRKDGKQVIFINEYRIFCICKPSAE